MDYISLMIKKNSKITSLKNFEAIKNEDNGVII